MVLKCVPMNHVPMLHQYQLKDPVYSIHNNLKLVKSNDKAPCSVQFAYLYPKDASDHRQWIFAFVRHQKGACDSLHNHRSSKICSKVKQMIADATELNPSIQPRDIARGEGVNAIPGAIDKVSNHMGRIAREVRKSKCHTTAGSNWDVANFEDVADDIDSKDEELTGDTVDSVQLKNLTRPYLVSAGIEDGIKFIFCMSPFMSSLLAESEFVEADIIYNETRESPYLFNMVAFSYITMDWVVVSHVRMTKQDASAYSLACSKTFNKCKHSNSDFEPASRIPKISAGNNIMSAFEVLCKKKSANTLLDVIEGLTKDDSMLIDSITNWSSATKWVEWWMRPQHLKLLHKDYSEMDEAIWERCPSNTNAVERKNLDSKESLPQQLQIAAANLYK